MRTPESQRYGSSFSDASNLQLEEVWRWLNQAVCSKPSHRETFNNWMNAEVLKSFSSRDIEKQTKHYARCGGPFKEAIFHQGNIERSDEENHDNVLHSSITSGHTRLYESECLHLPIAELTTEQVPTILLREFWLRNKLIRLSFRLSSLLWLVDISRLILDISVMTECNFFFLFVLRRKIRVPPSCFLSPFSVPLPQQSAREMPVKIPACQAAPSAKESHQAIRGTISSTGASPSRGGAGSWLLREG